LEATNVAPAGLRKFYAAAATVPPPVTMAVQRSNTKAAIITMAVVCQKPWRPKRSQTVAVTSLARLSRLPTVSGGLSGGRTGNSCRPLRSNSRQRQSRGNNFSRHLVIPLFLWHCGGAAAARAG